MYIADEENASDSFALHNYLDERDIALYSQL